MASDGFFDEGLLIGVGRLLSLPLAAADILVVLATIPWMIAAVSRHHPWVALAPVPYLARVAIATVLQLAITAWNR